MSHRQQEKSGGLGRTISRLFWGGGSILLGLLIFFTAMGVLLDGGLLGSLVFGVVGLAFVMNGLRAFPSAQRRYARRLSLTTFGRAQTVDRRTIRPQEPCYERCVVCGSSVDKGLVRRYRDEYVAAGFPLYTKSMGHNHYCLDCATDEMGLSDAGYAIPDDESATETDLTTEEA